MAVITSEWREATSSARIADYGEEAYVLQRSEAYCVYSEVNVKKSFVVPSTISLPSLKTVIVRAPLPLQTSRARLRHRPPTLLSPPSTSRRPRPLLRLLRRLPWTSLLQLPSMTSRHLRPLLQLLRRLLWTSLLQLPSTASRHLRQLLRLLRCLPWARAPPLPPGRLCTSAASTTAGGTGCWDTSWTRPR